MDKYRPCPSIIAMFTSDSQHPPRSKHAVYLGDNANQSAPKLSKGGDNFSCFFCFLLTVLFVLFVCFDSLHPAVNTF